MKHSQSQSELPPRARRRDPTSNTMPYTSLRLCTEVGWKRGHATRPRSRRGSAHSKRYNRSCAATVKGHTSAHQSQQGGHCLQQACPASQHTTAAARVLLYESRYVILQSCTQAKHARGKACALSHAQGNKLYSRLKPDTAQNVISHPTARSHSAELPQQVLDCLTRLPASLCSVGGKRTHASHG